MAAEAAEDVPVTWAGVSVMAGFSYFWNREMKAAPSTTVPTAMGW